MDGVSFVVPVCNGSRWLTEVLAAIIAEAQGRPFEVLVVDDASADESPVIAQRFAANAPVRLLATAAQGAAAAINLGVRNASFSVICQVDQDVIVQPGWLGALLCALLDPTVAAAQGYYATERLGSPWGRIAGYDLELRWAPPRERLTDHVCTGNSAYRAEALQAVGGFDESMGYGYDNDMSYRLGKAGYRLVFCPAARAVHRRREGLLPCLVQQYGQGYGRLDVIARHPERVVGDRVSGPGMIMHVPGTVAGFLATVTAAVLAVTGGPWHFAAIFGAVVLGLMVMERGIVAVRAATRFSDPAALLLLPAHLLRNVAWVAAASVWGWRRLRGLPSHPFHSMPRPALTPPALPARERRG